MLQPNSDADLNAGITQSILRSFRRAFKHIDPLFGVVVVLPVFISILYYGFFSSNIYVSESEFVVHSPDKPSQGGLGMLLKNAGFSSQGDELYSVQAFVTSRDALKAVNHDNAFKKAYTAPGISFFDRFDTLGRSDSFENLYKYFGKMVQISSDSSSVMTLTVKAFTPAEAFRVNEKLLEMSEAMVNRLNDRGRQDLLDQAKLQVERAKKKSTAAALALAQYRHRSGILDPAEQGTAQMGMVYQLQTQLITTKTELAQLRRFAPRNPRISVLKTQIASLQDEIDKQMAGITGKNEHSLSESSVKYQRYILESEFADKELAAALASLEDARRDSQRKQAYVERVVQPNLPDYPVEPRRLRGIFATLALSLAAFGILRMLLAVVKEHAL